jgi:hypothetical protein
MRRRLLVAALGAALFTACGGGRSNGAGGTASTASEPAPATTVTPSTTSTTAIRGATTTTRSVRAEEVVDSGTVGSGAWQLVATRDGSLLCAELRLSSRPAGRACNSATEQDANGNETLRYSTAGEGAFVVGVGLPSVARVQAELRDAATVERATVPASFTGAARFVAVPLRAGAVIRALTALDAGGRVLTRITINP